MNVKSIRLCVNDNVFKEFHKVTHNEVNIMITTYNTAAKCFGDLIEEYYIKEQRLDYCLVIDEAQLLLQHISLCVRLSCIKKNYNFQKLITNLN